MQVVESNASLTALFAPRPAEVASSEQPSMLSAVGFLVAVAAASNTSCLDDFRPVMSLPGPEKHCLLGKLDGMVSSPQRFHFEKIGVVVGYEILSKLGEIEFTIVVPNAKGWFGFGISEVGSMIGADMVIVEEQAEQAGSYTVTDSYSHRFDRPVADKLQNWKAESISQLWLEHDETNCPAESGTYVTKAVLRRMMKTCDAEDEDLGPEWIQNYFVAAYGSGRMSYHGAMRETTSHYMFLPEPILHEEALDAVEVDVLGPKIRVPEGQTNHCYIKVEIPCDLKVHAWAVLNITNLHHMHLGPLEPALDFPEQYQCSSYSPGQVSLSWGLGDAKKVLPNSLYIELKAGTYVLEAHFENYLKNAFDAQTGFRLWTATADLSPEKAVGITSINGVWRDILPANHIVEKSFVLTPACTDQIPAHGITVIGALAHLHYAGASLRAYRTRNGRSDMLFEQRGFDFNRQAVIYRSFKLMPGDVLSWTCTWDLRGLDGKTWGLSSADEMCQIFLAANPPLPFARGVVGIPAAGSEYGVCGTRACFDLEECSRLAPNSSEFHEILLEPTTREEGPRREICQLVVEAEATAPFNNWILPNSMMLQLGGLAASQAVISFLYRLICKEGDTGALKKSLNLLLALVGIIVGVIIACNLEWFGSEQEKVYTVTEASGRSYWSLNACADLVGGAYLFEVIVRGASRMLRWDLAVHHLATMVTIGMVRNAFAFEFAPQFYASIAACLLLHVVTDVPVLLIFACRGISAAKTCLKRSLWWAAWLKLAMHAAVNVCSLLLFYAHTTFHLATVSFGDWFKATYNKDRPSATDAMLRFDWALLLQLCMPVLVGILFLTQIWATCVLIRVSRKTEKEEIDRVPSVKEV